MAFTYSKGDLDAQPWYDGYANSSPSIPERYTDFTMPTDAQAQLLANIVSGFSTYQQGMWTQPGMYNGSSITFFSYNDRPGHQATGAINLGTENKPATAGNIWIGVENETYLEKRQVIAARLFHEVLHSNTRVDQESSKVLNAHFSEYSGIEASAIKSAIEHYIIGLYQLQFEKYNADLRGAWASFSGSTPQDKSLTYATSSLNISVDKVAVFNEAEKRRILAEIKSAVDSCFSCRAMVKLADGSEKIIADIRYGDEVLSFDASGALVPGRVTQILHNVTDTWLHLSNGTYVTPGHRYLRPDGSFAEIQDIIADDGRIVAADGSIQTVTAEVIRYSAETAHMFEEAEMLVYASEGGAALAPQVKRGWKTYNFTVAETHTYIADGIRVHNESENGGEKLGHGSGGMELLRAA